MKIKINDINFNIIKIDIKEYNNTKIRYSNFTAYHEPRPILMVAETAAYNKIQLDDWIAKSKSGYRTNLNFNTIKIQGLYPVTYIISKNNDDIYVNFSIDHIYGDINLFEITQLRKEKLKKIADSE